MMLISTIIMLSLLFKSIEKDRIIARLKTVHHLEFCIESKLKTRACQETYLKCIEKYFFDRDLNGKTRPECRDYRKK